MGSSSHVRASSARTWAQAMIESFGTTSDPRHAAFVLPDGTLVRYRARWIHEDMAQRTAPATVSTKDAYHSLVRFLDNSGAVRLHNWGREGDIELTTRTQLTREQLRALRKFVRYARAILVDVTPTSGQSEGGGCRLVPTQSRGPMEQQLHECLLKHSKVAVPPMRASGSLDGHKSKKQR